MSIIHQRDAFVVKKRDNLLRTSPLPQKKKKKKKKVLMLRPFCQKDHDCTYMHEFLLLGGKE